MKVAAHGYISCMQVRPGCAFVLEWNLPFRNPGSATAMWPLVMCSNCYKIVSTVAFL